MKIKHLGHQGWAISSNDDSTTVLLDIPWKTMGNGPITVDTYPTVDIDIELLSENANAAIISHEHADHFDIKCLKLIKRSNPNLTFFIPDITSPGIHRLLIEAGFPVTQYSCWSEITIGPITFIPLPTRFSRYEPDVYALYFKDITNNIGFFTSIDALETDETKEFILSQPNNIIHNYTNNYVARHFRQHDTQYFDKHHHLSINKSHIDDFVEKYNPKHVLISGLGWAYNGSSSHLNKIMFPVKHKDLANYGTTRYPNITFHACNPMDEFIASNKDFKILTSIDLIDNRNYDEDVVKNHYPRLISSDISDDDWKSLQTWITEEMGQLITLGAKQLTRTVHYIHMEGRDRSFCLSVFQKRKIHVFSLNLGSASLIKFGELESLESVKNEYPIGICVNAKMLMDIRLGRDEAHIDFEIGAHTWNDRRDLLNECSDVDISACLHPRFRKNIYGDYYVESWRKSED